MQDKGWASSTSAGIRTNFEDFSLFEASVSLTPLGLAHWEEVVAAIYSYISVLKDAPDEELVRIWNEMRACNALEFQYQEKSDAYELAPHLASNLLTYPEVRSYINDS